MGAQLCLLSWPHKSLISFYHQPVKEDKCLKNLFALRYFKPLDQYEKHTISLLPFPQWNLEFQWVWSVGYLLLLVFTKRDNTQENMSIAHKPYVQFGNRTVPGVSAYNEANHCVNDLNWIWMCCYWAPWEKQAVGWSVFPQHSVAVRSHLIKIIHTVISFLLWKAPGIPLLSLPARGLPKIGISHFTGCLFCGVRGCSMHP